MKQTPASVDLIGIFAVIGLPRELPARSAGASIFSLANSKSSKITQ
jgi:hypothetical protein